MRRDVGGQVRGADRSRVHACAHPAAPCRAGPHARRGDPGEGLQQEAQAGLDQHARAEGRGRGQAVSRLKDTLARGEFVVTGEVAPPVGTDVAAMRRSAETLGPHCHALNVTDNQAATLHLASLGACRLVLEWGFEPVFQQTCRDRNRLALQSDLLAASALGITNVLLLTGDDPRWGDHPEAKAVFDIDSTQLVRAAAGLNAGRDMHGDELTGATDLFIGAAVFPEAEPWDIQLARAVQKVDAGVEFFQTQAIFDTDALERAVAALRPRGVKVIAGVILLRSVRTIDFINERVAGLMVPEAVRERVAGAADPKEEAVALAIEQVRAIRGIADGVHIMPLGLDGVVPRILAEAGLT
ncbi:MAG: 5,10-methylenetetrahydrofolate reductase [Coriobacteriaceae bacterium]|nr:5,10-methylenetetrahydrofolate reductase [Coriobacteriaceae bacterium]